MTKMSATAFTAKPPANATKRQCGKVRRQQIAEAALRIISSRGLNRLTAAELAREVGIADGTIFRHFRDKQEIVLLAIGYLREILSQDLLPEHVPPLDRLESFVQNRLRLAEAHADLYALAFSDRLKEAAGERALALLTELAESTLTFVEDCLKAAQKEGTVDAQLPAHTLAIVLLGTIHASAALRTLRHWRTEDPPDAVWKTLKLLLSRSGAARPAAGEPEKRRADG